MQQQHQSRTEKQKHFGINKFERKRLDDRE